MGRGPRALRFLVPLAAESSPQNSHGFDRGWQVPSGHVSSGTPHADGVGAGATEPVRTELWAEGISRPLLTSRASPSRHSAGGGAALALSTLHAGCPGAPSLPGRPGGTHLGLSRDSARRLSMRGSREGDQESLSSYLQR